MSTKPRRHVGGILHVNKKWVDMHKSVYIEYTPNMAAWFYAHFNDVTFAINDRIPASVVRLFIDIFAACFF